MKKILVVNPKGGCGKTTITTNLASYYALWEVPVALIDLDPQQSSLEWLNQRGKHLGPIHGIDGSRGKLSVPNEVQRVVMDAPARTTTAQLRKLFENADEVLIPVLPSPIDIRAAGRFIGELLLDKTLRKSRVGLVANRARENTLIYSNLEAFLNKLKIPMVAHLRDTQNYIRAADSGQGIFEMAPYLVDKDMDTWKPLIKWIENDQKL
ncbi:MAG: ParA family protein [Acidiferrobacterales bacterium]|nr:ParA family protein [Acidiferrobacterales bacterium]